MEEFSLVLLIGCVTSFIATFLLGALVIDVAVRRAHERRLVHRTGLQNTHKTQLLYNGVAPIMPIARILGGIPWVRRYVVRVGDAFRMSGHAVRSDASMSVLIVCVVGIVVSTGLISSSLLCGIVGASCLILGLGMWSTRQRDNELVALREALPEALQSMKACFQVGYSLPQTLQELRESTQGPLSRLFGEVASVFEVGGSTEEALLVLKKQSSESELVFLAAALEIQHRTGSSMQHVLEATRQSVSDEIELKRSLRTQTAQAKLSAQIVTLMPFVLIGVFSLISPGFMAPFFESIAGLILLSVAIAMQALGIGLVRKMLNVEVG